METVQVVLTNRKATLIRPYDCWEQIRDVLKFRKPGWEWTPAAKWNGWDGYVHLFKYDTMSSGIFLALRTKIEKTCNIQFAVDDQRKAPNFDVGMTPQEVRPYQLECHKEMLAASGTGGLILNATGTGKTAIAGMYFRSLLGPGLFVVDELTLLKQAREELKHWVGEEIGEIGDSVFHPRRITVGTIQTIHRHRFDPKYVPWNKTLQAIIIDEIHVALNRRNFETLKVIQPRTVFGLTATLEIRKKDVAMRAYELTGPVTYEYPLEQGVKEGYLTRGIAISVEVTNPVAQPQYGGSGNWYKRVQFYRETYREEYTEVIVEGRKRNKFITDLIEAAYAQGKYTIVLVERVQHLKDLSSALSDIPHEVVYGARKVEDRTKAKGQFERGDLRLLIASKVFGKGVDIKRVDVMIDASAMKSRNAAVQKYGRGVRLCDGKKGLLYFDLSDVGNRFEAATKSRRLALKRIGIPVFRVNSQLGADEILALAEKKLDKYLSEQEKVDCTERA